MADTSDFSHLRRRKALRNNLTRLFIQVLVWVGAAVLYYLIFSLFADTPLEYRLKHSTDELRAEYKILSARYDSLSRVLDNITERDRNVFHILFESDPYNFEDEYNSDRWSHYEELLEYSTSQLQHRFEDQLQQLSDATQELQHSYDKMLASVDSCAYRNHLPAIQPIINKQLTLLTTSYGMRINPFQKVMRSHQGVDYAIPIGTSVFATADGVVKEVSLRNSTLGKTVVIDHGRGYETLYAHLNDVKVSYGQQVRRGDIIARSGNTGLSLAPHLHYEVRCNGMRVDPIHYFFMELSPEDYYRMMRIAQAGMQSFD
jgi:hypothetical protein